MKEENLCQAFSDALLCKIEDIDTEDWDNPQLCSDYVKDIYQYLRQLEVRGPLWFGCTAVWNLPHSWEGNGSVCVTDSSEYLDEVLTENDVAFYSLKEFTEFYDF